ncbi:hypothetical protein CIHG_10344 [Coccidioides immitis H538.4]|uniref:Uncharacterized protein n=2 Tax=Coccidioides immitis TaxID=5501 RepID=A0A0J8S5T8_COCIT|nr:hypothetical protein CIRG_09668 [Coccidioides immitis RMSCC 2394]KMU92542.1 hypothetical protein CIHG_10344 [Coccidioides immitis H538.4]
MGAWSNFVPTGFAKLHCNSRETSTLRHGWMAPGTATVYNCSPVPRLSTSQQARESSAGTVVERSEKGQTSVAVLTLDSRVITAPVNGKGEGLRNQEIFPDIVISIKKIALVKPIGSE